MTLTGQSWERLGYLEGGSRRSRTREPAAAVTGRTMTRRRADTVSNRIVLVLVVANSVVSLLDLYLLAGALPK